MVNPQSRIAQRFPSPPLQAMMQDWLSEPVLSAKSLKCVRQKVTSDEAPVRRKPNLAVIGVTSKPSM